jgi:hypothetical protein
MALLDMVNRGNNLFKTPQNFPSPGGGLPGQGFMPNVSELMRNRDVMRGGRTTPPIMSIPTPVGGGGLLNRIGMGGGLPFGGANIPNPIPVGGTTPTTGNLFNTQDLFSRLSFLGQNPVMANLLQSLFGQLGARNWRPFGG